MTSTWLAEYIVCRNRRVIKRNHWVIIQLLLNKRPDPKSKKEKGKMNLPKDYLSKELVEEELKALVEFTERHLHWAKAVGNQDHARLNMVAAESLIEAAHLIRALCERLGATD